jgi:hypothetical protein
MFDVHLFSKPFIVLGAQKDNLALLLKVTKFLCPASGNSGPAIFTSISIQVVSRYEIADPLN